ncbi:UNVERIFIED_CONTAM: hypothetical protein HDU68_012811 [Siphonaria sp. JEL0065]|nr:hypothetical protein HDU68_012811 [Siphonaria sp. JEL0065]
MIPGFVLPSHSISFPHVRHITFQERYYFPTWDAQLFELLLFACPNLTRLSFEGDSGFILSSVQELDVITNAVSKSLQICEFINFGQHGDTIENDSDEDYPNRVTPEILNDRMNTYPNLCELHVNLRHGRKTSKMLLQCASVERTLPPWMCRIRTLKLFYLRQNPDILQLLRLFPNVTKLVVTPLIEYQYEGGWSPTFQCLSGKYFQFSEFLTTLATAFPKLQVLELNNLAWVCAVSTSIEALKQLVLMAPNLKRIEWICVTHFWELMEEDMDGAQEEADAVLSVLRGFRKGEEWKELKNVAKGCGVLICPRDEERELE